ncbi:MAG: sensor histidine kinase [Acutalibacteraceae bacterium]
MVVNILFFLVFFFEMLISAIFFSSIVDKKFNLPLIILIGTVIFEIGTLINIFLVSTVWLNVLFSFIANYAFSVLCFRIKSKKAAFYSLVLVAVSTFIELATLFLMTPFANLYMPDYRSDSILLVVEMIISKTLYFIIAMLLSKISQKNNTNSKIPAAFYIFPLITLVAVICFWYISFNQNLNYKNQIILGIVSVLLFLATIVVFFSFQSNAQKENRLLLLQQEKDKIKTDLTYYDILERQNNNLRSYAHDTKNHLSAIKNLNSNPQIDSYITEMIERLDDYGKVCRSGNRILDVIIDKYVTECKLNHITFDFDIKSNNLSDMDDYDIVTVLGNLLDNAVEAAEKSGSKHISLETDYRNNFSVIIISNSCGQSPVSNRCEIPATTKSNKRLHGFGLKSVRNTVKKYNGDIAFDYDAKKKEFTVTVMTEHQP